MNKPKITAGQYNQFMALNKLHMAMNNERRSAFFRGSSFGGGDPFADMKHGKAWFDYGYPMEIDFYMQWNMYKRNGLAKAGVNIPVNLCWMDPPKVREGDDDQHEETAWEKSVKKLFKRIGLWRAMRAADKMQRVGRFSALFLRVRDGQSPDKPIGRINEAMLMAPMPIWEGQLEPGDIETDLKSENYGQPKNYTYSAAGTGNQDKNASQSFTIHHSRLIILSEDAAGGSIYGTPVNEAGFNALLDWDKIRGSGAEASWLSASNKQILTPTQPGSVVNQKTLDDINDAIKALKEGMDESLFIDGVTATPMNNTVPDPEIYKQMALEEYSASVGIAAKILVGTQSGVKAGDEDTGSLMRLMQSRRINDLTGFIDLFMNWLFSVGAVVMPSAGYAVAWSDLTAPSATQKIDYVLKMSQANAANIGSGDGLLFTGDEMRKEAGFDPMTGDEMPPDETLDD